MADRDREKPDSDNKEDLLATGKALFQKADDAESENRSNALDDIRFSRLNEQWPSEIAQQRQRESRPCLTINKMPAFIRQVVNDSRQNKPQIKVHPVDSGADKATAEIINGLIRNIEYTSNADVAYDTAIEASVSGGFGYWRIGMDYSFEDSFEMDLTIERVANQFAVYGDPNSMSADSSDWNDAFVIDRVPKKEFERKYKGKKNVADEAVCVDFDSDAWADAPWLNDDGVLVAEWWHRKVEEVEVVKLSNGGVYAVDELETNEDVALGIAAGVLSIAVGPDGKEMRRKTQRHKVRQVIMTGADVLEVNEWPGRFIPIVPVYGDEIVVEGKRYFRSLIHNAKDAQRMFNYWRTTSTELVALAPRVPYIGRKGSFDHDSARWATANTTSHAYLEFEGEMPQRQPLDVGPAAGALQEALNASDDMKAIVGIYDASLGARSNETSGRAIMARQREGDVATFHFIDNLTRAIRHTGRILIDLIPHVYNAERIIRVMGEDGTPKEVKVNGETQAEDEEGNPAQDAMGNAIMAIHDLTVGKYDLTVTSGPSFTTRREESAAQMVEFIQAYPDAAPVIGDLLAKNLDWPGSDEIARRLQKLIPGQQEIPPELQQQLEALTQQVQELTLENASLKQGHDIDQFNADTKRMQVQGDMNIDRARLGFDMVKAANEPAKPVAQFPKRQG